MNELAPELKNEKKSSRCRACGPERLEAAVEAMIL